MSTNKDAFPKVRIPRKLYDELMQEVRLCRREINLDIDLSLTKYVRQALEYHMMRVSRAREQGDKAHRSEFRRSYAAQNVGGGTLTGAK